MRLPAATCQDETTHRPPGRPRCPKAREAILDAAHAALRDHGFAGMTIEGVAERAGVGKATVYRWWPDKGALAVDAFFAGLHPRITYRDTGSARRDLSRQVRSVVREMNGPMGRLVASIIAAMQTDPALAETFRARWLPRRRSGGAEGIRRAIERGELRQDVDATFIFDALYGPIYFRLLMGHAPITPALARRLVDMVFAAIEVDRDTRAPRPRSPARSQAKSIRAPDP
ncbi:MAG: TetR/AcrR family transcriptional regulator [Phycisphaerales bacterium]